MPTPYFPPGIGETDSGRGLTITYFAPSDTNDTTNLIVAGQPLKLPAINTNVLVRTANNDVPECIAAHRQQYPSQDLAVRVIPNAVAGSSPSGEFVAKITYTGAIPAGESQVLADGSGTWKLVLKTAGTGIGRVLSAVGASGGTAYVLF